MHGAKRRKIQIAGLYAVLGGAVLGYLIWTQTFPEFPLWLAFAVAFAFFDWRSVEVNDRMLMSPTVMVALTAAVAFGPGQGTWTYDSGGWTRLTGWDAVLFATWVSKLVVGFDSDRGLWTYDVGGWTRLTSWDPEAAVAWGDRLAVDFGDGRGLWLYETGGWQKLSHWDPQDLITWGDQLAVDFGDGPGLWSYDMSSWAQLTSWDPVENCLITNRIIPKGFRVISRHVTRRNGVYIYLMRRQLVGQ